MKQLIRKFKQISILILAILVVGCNDDETLLPKVVAGFTYTLNEETGTVTFINISENSQTYVWAFGDNPETSSTEINPIKTYESGTYTVILKAKNRAGASATFETTITINVPLPIVLPITFDVANVNYDPDTFNGTSFAIVDNPAPGGTNNVASKVGAITNSGAAFEGINFDLGTQIDLTTNKSIKMNFWSDKVTTVLMKLEEGTGAAVETTVAHGGTGWEEMIFSFSSANKYSRLTLFVDGPGTTSGTFYMDDVMQIPTPAPPCTPETVETLTAAGLNWTFKTDQTSKITNDGANFSWVDNPDTDNAVNASCKIGKVTKLGQNPWDNNQISLDAKLDFNTNAGLKVKVWSAKAGTKVRMKLEEIGVAPSNNPEVEVTMTKTSEWEELTFPFASTNHNKYNKIVMFFDLNANNSDTYYFDDLKVYAGGGGGGGGCTADAAQSLTSPAFNLTFATDPGTTPTKGAAVGKFFQDNATYTYVDNPGASTVNNSCKVGKVTNGNVEAWDNLQMEFADKFTFSDGDNFTMKVYSPQSGYKITLKFENATASDVIEVPSTTATTKTNDWEQLTFPVGLALNNRFTRLVLFFDLQTKNGNTYYFDDLKLNRGTGGGGGGGGGGTCPAPPSGQLLSNGNFEAGDVGCWQFLNGTSISSTINNGGTKSGQLTGKTGQAVGLKQERFAVGSIQPNTSYTVSFDIKASGAFPDGAVLKAFTFSEGADGGSVGATLHTLTDNTSSVSTTAWESKTYTFTTPSNANQVAGGLSFLIELVNASINVNVDNVVVKKTP